MTLHGRHDFIEQSEARLRVCYFGTYRAEYVRNRILIEGLRRNGVEVIECHETLWHSIEDRVSAVKGKWKSPRFWRRVITAYAKLLWKYFRMTEDYDVLVVGYPGHFDVFVASMLARLSGKPLAWDIYMSLYLISVERGLDKSSPSLVNAISNVERTAMRLPNALLMDTRTYVEWFGKNYHIEEDRFRILPNGVDSDIYLTSQPSSGVQDSRENGAPGRFRVLYYGTFIPNHGVLTITEAARILRRHADIQFDFVGDGPQRKEVEELIRKYGLQNIRMIGWLDSEALREQIRSADLCLGVFGLTPQSLMTVHHKIKECMATGKPVLSGDSPAVRDEFVHERDLYLCPRANAQQLANAIVLMQQQPKLRTELGRRAQQTMRERYTIEENGRRMKQYLQGLL